MSGTDTIRTVISYSAGVMQVTLSNTVTMATFITNFTVGSLPALLGADTAYVGFTGADGGTPSLQTVSDFKFIPVPTLTAQSSGTTVVLSWPASIGGYKIQSATSLTSPVWVDAGYREYAKRLPPECALRLVEIEPGHRGKGASAEVARREEGVRLLAALPKGAQIEVEAVLAL